MYLFHPDVKIKIQREVYRISSEQLDEAASDQRQIWYESWNRRPDIWRIQPDLCSQFLTSDLIIDTRKDCERAYLELNSAVNHVVAQGDWEVSKLVKFLQDRGLKLSVFNLKLHRSDN